MGTDKLRQQKEQAIEKLNAALGHKTVQRLGAASLLAAATVASLGSLSETNADIGPTSTKISISISGESQTVIDGGPFGKTKLNTHDGLLDIRADVGAVNMNKIKTIVSGYQTDKSSLSDLPQDISIDIKKAEQKLLLETSGKLIVFGEVLALMGLLVAIKKVPNTKELASAAIYGTIPLAISGLVMGLAAITQNDNALATAEFTGPMQYAPKILDGIETIPSKYDDYSQQTAKLVDNIVQLYQTGENLPVLPDQKYIKIMVISDIHCNEGTYDTIKKATELMGVRAIIDAGDITDYGSDYEPFCYKPVGTLGVPYVYVKGNHDSYKTVDDLSQMPNVHIAQNGDVFSLFGIQMAGVADPRYEADSNSNDNDPRVEQSANILVNAAQNYLGLDIAIKHDPSGNEVLAGEVPLVISGHMHARSAHTEGQTLFYTEGSTGGAGLRAFDNGSSIDTTPTEQTASIFYWDPSAQKFVAVEQLTLGGLGTNKVSLNRCLITDKNELNC